MTDINTLVDQYLEWRAENEPGVANSRVWDRFWDEDHKKVAQLKQALNLYIEERERLAYGRGTIDTLDHVKEWADKTEVTYNDMMSDRIKELEG